MYSLLKDPIHLATPLITGRSRVWPTPGAKLFGNLQTSIEREVDKALIFHPTGLPGISVQKGALERSKLMGALLG
jgi:hypothetical protein